MAKTQTASKPVQVAAAVSYVAMIAINALANTLPINGRTTGGVSDAYQNLFAPAGLTFAVWGVIYLLLGAHVLYQLGLFHDDSRQTAGRAALLQRVGVLFSLTCLVNISWIFAWHYDAILLSALLLVGLLVLLILITRTVLGAELSARDKVFVRVPFSVYFGWITVATIANATVWLVSVGWNGFGIAEPVWAVGIIAVGALIGAAVIVRDRDIAYALVLVWAFLGIWIKHTSADGFAGAYPAVSVAALVGVAVFLLAGGLVVGRRAVR